MRTRPLIVLLIVAAVAAALDAALWRALAEGGWTYARAVLFAAFVLSTPWLGFYVANGLIGFVILMRRADTPADWDRAAPPPPAALPMTVLAVTVRHEDMDAVLPPLRRLLDELDATGAGDRFALAVLSDSSDPPAIAAEERAVAAFRATDRDPGRIRYRRRLVNEGFKAGNVMEFLDHHAAGFTVMVTLDADSRMSARAVLRLVGTLARNPQLAIVQHLTVGLPASSAFPRLFQFGMRAGMRTWATGLAWWQGDQACYWGHNAAIRIDAFRTHARLPRLPDGRHILSHDQVEAALLAGAGWGVRLIPEEDGSAEANPPALPEFLRRDLRWLAGNLEYRHLLGLPALRPMGRWQLIQAILLFGCAPLHLLILLAAAWMAATGSGRPVDPAWALVTVIGWLAAIHSPKLLGYLEVLIRRTERARYGGAGPILLGIGLETAFSLAIDPISLISKTAGMMRLALGRPAAWTPQNRADRSITWREAARLLWPQTLIGWAMLAAFAQAGPLALGFGLALAGGAAFAVPFCVLTADPRVGACLRRNAIAAIPEELTDRGGSHG